MKLAVTMELHAYWNRLRGARSAPERNDVDPGAIRGVLADTFVLAFDAAHGFPFRIAGSRANAIFLQELRRRPFLDLWREAERGELKAVLQGVADEAQPFLIGAQARPPGFEALDLEIILLPLRHHGLTHSRLLGAIGAHGAPGWMGLVAAGPLALCSLRALAPARATPVPESAAEVRFSLRDPPRRYKHLFVYPGDRAAP